MEERLERKMTNYMDPSVVDKSNNLFLIEFNFSSYHSMAMLGALPYKSNQKQSSGIIVRQCYYTG
jgi:outer membrane usher protein FimD/PapC